MQKLGPFGMFERLLHDWSDRMSPRQVYEKVRRFYWCVNPLSPGHLPIHRYFSLLCPRLK